MGTMDMDSVPPATMTSAEPTGVRTAETMTASGMVGPRNCKLENRNQKTRKAKGLGAGTTGSLLDEWKEIATLAAKDAGTCCLPHPKKKNARILWTFL